MTQAHSMTLRADYERFDRAMALLVDVAQRAPEPVQGFLDGIGGAAQLVCIRTEALAAPWAGDVLVVFEPADALVEFLAAMRAGDVDAG